MHRIQGPGATPLKQFTEGDPELGVAPTEVTADWMNAVQEELAFVIERAGLQLNRADQTQLDAAIRALVGLRRQNLLDNGSFQVYQRGVGRQWSSGGPDNDLAYFAADRWQVAHAAGDDSVQIVVPHSAASPLPEGARNYLEIDMQSTPSASLFLIQRMESVKTLANRYAALQFWAKIDSGTLQVTPQLIQDFGTGGSPSSTVTTSFEPVTLTTTWQRFQPTPRFIPSIIGKTLGTNVGSDNLRLVFVHPSGGGPFKVSYSRVLLQDAEVSTPYEEVPFALDLLRCQRFFFKTYPHDAKPGNSGGTLGGAVGQRIFVQSGEPLSGTLGLVFWGLNVRFPIEMRTAPIVHWWSPTSGAHNVIRGTTIESSPMNSDFTPDDEYLGDNTQTGAPRLVNPSTFPQTAKYNDIWAHAVADAEWNAI